MIRGIRMISLAAAIGALGACTQMGEQLRHFPEIFNPKVNVKEYNFAAADDLVGQAKPTLTLSMPIAVGNAQPLNLKTGEKTPPFGRYTADQITARLIQLGYNVTDIGVDTRAGFFMTERDWIETGRSSGADVIVTGNYTISEYDILVHLRMINLRNSRLLAATDYRIPLGSDTYQLINRDPYFSLPARPKNNPEQSSPTAVYAPPLPDKTKASTDLPVRIIP